MPYTVYLYTSIPLYCIPLYLYTDVEGYCKLLVCTASSIEPGASHYMGGRPAYAGRR